MSQGRISLDTVDDSATIIKKKASLVARKMSVCFLTWIGEIGNLIKKTTYRTSNVNVLLPVKFKLDSIINSKEYVLIKVDANPTLDGDVLWQHKNQLEIQGISFEIKLKPRYTLGFITFQTKVLECVNK